MVDRIADAADGRGLRVENVSPAAARVFEMIGVTDVLMNGDVDDPRT